MMSDDVVIRAEGLGKKYSIGHQAADRQNTLRDTISHGFANFARTTRDLVRGKPIIAGDDIEDLWALKNVGFEIQRGQTTGIIGRNGAGKSTLLKVISRITEPSEGQVEIRGRVASLLEVGTGFHPELSGRENIFLNGAILGMSRAEIRRKFDEIVDFAGIEKFLDTPVKRYSSGMYVRLAFAVAAHLEPEILIVDEVLAVGDAEFQQKCLGKMQDVAGQGRTVIFVSHNVGLIQQLCDFGIHLDQGQLANVGPIEGCVRSYLTQSSDSSANVISFSVPGDSAAIKKISYDERALRKGILDVQMQASIPNDCSHKLYAGFILKSATGIPVWGSNNQIHDKTLNPPRGSGTFRCQTPIMPLISGNYFLSAWLSSEMESLDSQLDALEIILQHNIPQAKRPSTEVMGYIELPPHWSFEQA